MPLPERFNLDGRLPGLQQVPVLLQFLTVDLDPRLNETALRDGDLATKHLGGIDGEHRGVFLVVSVEMGPVMLAARFGEHPNDDSEEPGEFRHSSTLPSSDDGLSVNASVHQRRPIIAPAAVWCNAMLGSSLC